MKKPLAQIRNAARVSPKSVLLNRRLIFFPEGERVPVVHARLAKFTEQAPAIRIPKPEQWLPLGTPAPRIPFPDHPFEAIAHTVKHRLENPMLRASQRAAVAKFGKGSNGRKKVVASYTPADDAKSVSFGGFRERQLSRADVEEIRGEISVILAERTTPLDFAAWKLIFSASRRVLRMKRKLEREHLLDSLEELQAINFHSELNESREQRESRERDEQAAEANAEREWSVLVMETRYMVQCILAAHRAANSRKSNHRKRTALAYLRRAVAAMRGFGHSHTTSRTAAYNDYTRFMAYIAEGEEQLNREADEDANTWRESQNAILMQGVSA